MKLTDLGTVYQQRKFEPALKAIEELADDALINVGPTHKIPLQLKPDFVRGLCSYAKVDLSNRNFERALRAFQIAHEIDPAFATGNIRLALVKDILNDHKLIPWRISLIEMQRALRIVCHENHCNCVSHFQIASCMGLVTPLHDVVGGVNIHTVSHYYPYYAGDNWTKLLSAVKHRGEAHLLDPMADVLADFIFESTAILKTADILVPIPPSTDKFGHRGFAPNDIVAKRLQRRLALPCEEYLVRKPGPSTRESSYEELAAQFSVVPRCRLDGRSVLLIEDIWTWGRTIPICAKKLIEAGASSVNAVALGKSSGFTGA